MSTDATTDLLEPSEAATEAPEAEPATFDADYVKKLRSEAAQRRREAKEATERLTAQEAELAELREARLQRAVADVNAGRMSPLADVSDIWIFADPATFLDDAGKPDPQRIEAAIADVVQRKPHLVAPVPTITRGVQVGPPPPPPSIGALIGRAARGQSEGA
jgi:hypothetical protein